ncbi:MAG: pilus assembly protein N-terminal domain-containing protein [Gemmatimonadetes bacterium]|nr:pilus assembly protein N-terminal domain-containing protein [Gemmatimonadota bacterium]
MPTTSRARTGATLLLRVRRALRAAPLLVPILSTATPLRAQGPAAADAVIPVELVAGRALPLQGAPVAKVTVANPDVADVVVVNEGEVVITANAPGETDIILWGSAPGARRHYRVVVRSAAARRQVVLAVKFAEVRRETLRQLGASLLYRSTNGNTRAGTGLFRTDQPLAEAGKVALPSEARFLTALSNFNTRDLLALLEAEEQRGNARFLAEPTLMAADREEASFLAGGEIPIPLVQGGASGQQAFVTIQFREFGVRLAFRGEVLGDSLVKLKVRPEVSSLDYTNAVTIQGFRVPALRTRRVESTVDVLQDRSLVISGLFNEEREAVRAGLPLLGSIPVLGALFSSQRWQRSESELVVVVTPALADAAAPRPADLLRFRPDTLLPARPALERRLPPDTLRR